MITKTDNGIEWKIISNNQFNQFEITSCVMNNDIQSVK